MKEERNPDHLNSRLKAYALRIINLFAALPKNGAADILGRQILRSGTSPGAQFREALRARSKAEYVSKLNGGLQELDETDYWLSLLWEANIIEKERLDPLIKETDELMAIFVSLINKHRPK